MQHRARSPRSHDCQVQRRFGRWRAGASHHPAVLVDLDDVARLQHALIDTACRDRHREGLPAVDRAEVAAAAERPAARVAQAADLGELAGERREAHLPPPSSSEHAPRRAGQRGVSENPWTVSSKPRSLRATVVISERQTSVSGCRRSATSRVSDSSGANTAFAGAADAFQVYAASRQPVASNVNRFSRSSARSTTVAESPFTDTRALIGTAAHDRIAWYFALA